MGRTVNSSNIIQDWKERTENCYTYILTGSAQNLECIRNYLEIFFKVNPQTSPEILISRSQTELMNLHFFIKHFMILMQDFSGPHHEKHCINLLKQSYPVSNTL